MSDKQAIVYESKKRDDMTCRWFRTPLSRIPIVDDEFRIIAEFGPADKEVKPFDIWSVPIDG